MESGNTPENQTTNATNSTSAPVVPKNESRPAPQLPANDPYDWKNYRSNPKATAPKTSSGAGAAAVVLSIFSLLIAFGSTGVAVWAVTRNNNPSNTATVSGGYYSGNTVEFE